MSTDKMRIKSEKTGLEQEVTPEQYKELDTAFPGRHRVIKTNTTPPEVAEARTKAAARAAGNASTPAAASN